MRLVDVAMDVVEQRGPSLLASFWAACNLARTDGR
jgi:hypothetical protein